MVRNTPIIFACDGKARATFTASWYRQMGHQDVYIVDGGTTAWTASGRSLESGSGEPQPFGLAAARAKVELLSPAQLQAAKPEVIIFVETSQDFARGHIPGAQWVPRGWLEHRIGTVVPSHTTHIAVICLDGRNAALAGATLKDLDYQHVAVLEGGMAAWRQAGLPVEQGLSGIMSAPNDVVLSGPERNFADAMNYLRWEEALGYKYAPQGH
jgi:rhodanese-related sulfurtransferase